MIPKTGMIPTMLLLHGMAVAMMTRTRTGMPTMATTTIS